MGTGKDVKKRKRRPMTTEEHAARGKKNHGTVSIANIYSKVPKNNDEGDAAGVEEERATGMDADDDELPNDSNDSANEEKPSSNRVINDEGFSLRAVGVSNPSPVKPSIDEGDDGDDDGDDGDDDGDDGIDFDDDEAGDDNERGRKRVRFKRTDFQWLYMVALQKRLRKELKTRGPDQVNGLQSKWLIKWLNIHDWNVPWYCATHICNLLGMDAKQISLPAYYCDVKVWLPDKQHGVEAATMSMGSVSMPNCLSTCVIGERNLKRTSESET